MHILVSGYYELWNVILYRHKQRKMPLNQQTQTHKKKTKMSEIYSAAPVLICNAFNK
jgi:hypothetical protein